MLLPSLGISADTWEVNRKPDPKLEMNGIYALHNDVYKNWYSLTQVQGLKWMNHRNRTSRLILQKNGKPLATLRITKPQPTIKIVANNGSEPKVIFKVDMRAEMLELWQTADEKELEKAANEKVRGDIVASFRYSLSNGADLFNIEHVLYRKHFKQWKQLTNNGQITYMHEQMPEMHVNVHLTDSGMYKLQRKLIPYD
ncbi:Ger(x)C family spore germination C-terminal domain-containing protein [Cohnella yongneupensis]|uniref:Ger(X)C family spore germination C-terminal domain-containing protein n=1 Tax=Cohnella yongneupensis TaxID=425006 RepID=A0ABW0R3Z7_9BACL